jgi:hypothetical protein
MNLAQPPHLPTHDRSHFLERFKNLTCRARFCSQVVAVSVLRILLLEKVLKSVAERFEYLQARDARRFPEKAPLEGVCNI